eukprot:evm.model.scf_419EXC.10 EVM.evm.TU.scf_419EXC.10   scf_419EXC:80422-87567(-)
MAHCSSTGNAGCPSGVPTPAPVGNPSAWLPKAETAPGCTQNPPVENDWWSPVDAEVQAALMWAVWRLNLGGHVPRPPLPPCQSMGCGPFTDTSGTQSLPPGETSCAGTDKFSPPKSADQTTQQQQVGRDRKRQRQCMSEDKPTDKAIHGFETISMALQRCSTFRPSTPCSVPPTTQDIHTSWRFSRQPLASVAPMASNPGDGSLNVPASTLTSGGVRGGHDGHCNAAPNLNDSFVGSNALNGSNNSSYSSQGGRGSKGCKGHGHLGQSAWSHGEPSGWGGGLQEGAEVAPSMPVVPVDCVGNQAAGALMMHKSQNWDGRQSNEFSNVENARQRQGEQSGWPSCSGNLSMATTPSAGSGMTPESIGMLLGAMGASSLLHNQGMQQNYLVQMLMHSQGLQQELLRMGGRAKGNEQSTMSGVAPKLDGEGSSQLLNLLMQSGWNPSEAMSGVWQQSPQMPQN